MTAIAGMLIVDRGPQIGRVDLERQYFAAFMGFAEFHAVAVQAVIIAWEGGLQRRDALYLVCTVTFCAGPCRGLAYDKGMIWSDLQALISVAGPA